VIVSEVDCAINVYHTSYLSDAPQPGAGKLEGFQVELTFVPAVFTQDVEEVSAIAPAQLSLDGCAKAAMAQVKIKEQINSILLVDVGWTVIGFIELDFYLCEQDIRCGKIEGFV